MVPSLQTFLGANGIDIKIYLATLLSGLSPLNSLTNFDCWLLVQPIQSRVRTLRHVPSLPQNADLNLEQF